MPAPPARDHLGRGRVREPDQRDHVELDLPHLGVEIERVERAEGTEAHVVHRARQPARSDRGSAPR